MALSNHERVGKTLDLLNHGLRPFVEREFAATYKERAQPEMLAVLQQSKEWQGRNGQVTLDTQALLALMTYRWNEVFYSILGPAERGLVGELRGWRNKWAHQEAFSTDDTYRALDSAQRLLSAISAPEAEEIEGMRQEVLRTRFEEQIRTERRRKTSTPIEGQPAGNVKPWREIVTPHPDVASGTYKLAEFAADLNQVYKGEGSAEYRDPAEFFARTYVTEGLRHLLVDALQRLSGDGGDPVLELKTNFGGGKTHSMIALYHLFSGQPAASLPGVEPLLQEAGVSRPPAAHRAVLAGQALSPAQPRRKPDGAEVRTLWGEMAWQLLGAEGLALVAEADRRGVSPGSDVLIDLFRRASPALILIDEWVTYLRQLYHLHDLPAGSFEANLTFAHALTEAARAVSGTLVVASLPASEIEVGGEGGREALARLSQTFGRVESPWRPAGQEESFEIVRRRLFQPVDPALYPARDAAIRAFSDLYRQQTQEFPSGCGEGEYERRMRSAYPIHPELFDRLYENWSALERFQRTRGVLRLMATVIRVLWERNDAGLLILPAAVPIDESQVQFELTQYLEDSWVPVIETDVDGESSLPLKIDRETPNLGRYSAARRVARTIFMGSAPTQRDAKKGQDERHIKLGCVQPGESVATFGDALRRLTDREAHLYVDGNRYWFSTQPSVTRLAEDRAAQIDAGTVTETIETELRKQASARGSFDRVHLSPASSADIPDEREARLVILPPSLPHSSRAADSPARREAEAILRARGASPRQYQNTLVFLAADRARLEDLGQAVRSWLAWSSIVRDGESLDLTLDNFQTNQATTKRDQAETIVRQRIPETYVWLLAPDQAKDSVTIEWNETRLQGEDAPAARAGRRLVNEGSLTPRLAATVLRHYLDTVPLWRGDSVGVKQLAEDFARYLYLPRLTDEQVLLAAITEGVGSLTWETDAFAYAEGWDEQRQRYLGLKARDNMSPLADGHSLLVKPEVARRQMDAERPVHPPAPEPPPATEPGEEPKPEPTGPHPTPEPEPAPAPHLRYYGSVGLDALRLARDADRIAQEIVQHLLAQPDATVKVTLEIEADLPEGAPEHVIRTVTENGRTLHVEQGFEEKQGAGDLARLNE